MATSRYVHYRNSEGSPWFSASLCLSALLILGLPGNTALRAETPAPACKSTGTGTLEMIPLESKVFGNKRLLRVWLPPDYSVLVAPRSGIPCSTFLMGRCFLTVAHPSRFQMSGVWTKP